MSPFPKKKGQRKRDGNVPFLLIFASLPVLLSPVSNLLQFKKGLCVPFASAINVAL